MSEQFDLEAAHYEPPWWEDGDDVYRHTLKCRIAAENHIVRLEAELARLTARVGELEAERQPVSVCDRMPEAGAPVLVKTRKGEWCCARWIPSSKIQKSKWEEVGGDRWWIKPGITHWMPAPPEVAP